MDELLELIKASIQQDDYREKLNEIFEDYHPYDIANIFKELTDQERQAFYESLNEDKLADIFEYMDEEDAALYLKEMSYAKGANVLNEMEADDAADVLNEFDDDEEASQYLKQMDEEDAATLNYLIEREEDTAGSIMTTNYITLDSEMDVKEAMKKIGYEANDAEIIDPLFVCENEHLVGILSLKDLIVARTPCKIKDIMDENFVYGEVNEDTISISNKIADYDIYALPIIDQGKMVGVVTMDDALDVTSEAISEDYAKMATADAEVENELPVWKNILKRLPWLIALLIFSLLISNLTEKFEGIIKSITVLWFFNTMILDMAGNAGTQSLAVSVRHLGRNDLDNGKKTFKYILRELVVTIIISLILGLVSFLITYLFIIVLKYNTKVNALITSLVISSSLSLTLIITGSLGSIVPIIMNKIHIDPAVASGPLITTLNDVIAMLIYFGLAYLLYDYIIL